VIIDCISCAGTQLMSLTFLLSIFYKDVIRIAHRCPVLITAYSWQPIIYISSHVQR